MCCLAAAALGLGGLHADPAPLGWPEAGSQARLWTRWWWLGSAVDDASVDALLAGYKSAGWGGVELCPIYGARGYEARFIPFLSDAWVARYAHMVTEARRLGLDVDLTTGSGWPNGGPWVDAAHASEAMILRRLAPGTGAAADLGADGRTIRAVVAVSPSGESADITQGASGWRAPGAGWTVYAVLTQSPIQQVKRAAPGAEGNVLDPFSTQAMDLYTARFDAALAGKAPAPRAQFHDSYEYEGAAWTPGLLDAFRERRGYDLRTELAALSGEGPAGRVARVKCDYRETIGELHQAYIARWTAWSHAHGSLSREQAHGAPANIEDVYATADIPETEVFGQPGDGVVPMVKFASSAAHLAGRPLASSETFTWLGEHFQVPLSALKPEADLLFLSGINHLILHGTPYSPPDAPWPGWLFYASVNFGPNGGLWHDMPAFSAYVARCQSILQAGRPSSDVLVYFPIYDYWQRPEGMLLELTTPGAWMRDTAFFETAQRLWSRGYAYESATDRMIAAATADASGVHLGGMTFQAVVVPRTRVMPVGTLGALGRLARAGARVVFEGGPPEEVPGLGELDARSQALAGLRRELFGASPAPESRLSIGAGLVEVSVSVDGALERLHVRREAMADLGLSCVRRRRPDGEDYFIVNRSAQAFDGWVPLSSDPAAALILDPLEKDRIGVARTEGRAGERRVLLQLAPGASVFVRTAASAPVGAAPWPYLGRRGPGLPVEGPWRVHFLEGGPVLPADFTLGKPGPWTDTADPECRRVMGTARYGADFEWRPSADADEWLLSLGDVGASARVRVNGTEIAVLWAPPFEVPVGRWLRPGRNTVEVDVTNLAANRIADLDRRGVAWRRFYDINFVNRDYRPFDASGWPVLASGLLGPVTLVPVARRP